MAKDQDTEFYDVRIERVSPSGDGHEIAWESTLFSVPPGPIVPKPGMTARFYGKGFGAVVRGLDIDGHEFFYRTPEEQEERYAQQLAELRQRQRDNFEKNRASMDADFNRLPPEFQARLVRFRRNRPSFRWELEGYEVFCCKEAVKIAMTLGTAKNIEAFGEAEYEQQKLKVPQLKYDAHSGNTFGFSIRLAWLYVTCPELVATEHGALCPLTGCIGYGCVADGATEYDV